MTQSAGPQICVVIARTRHKMMQFEIQEAARRGATLIELRLDFLAKAPDFKRLLAEKPCPLVATVRRQADGGRWTGTEEARLTLLRQAIVAGFDWVDLETDIAGQIRRFGKVKRIISYHNLREVPPDLEKIHEAMCLQDPDVVKLAVTAHHPADNLRALELASRGPTPTVAFCMGDLGTASRVLGGRYGQPFAYAAFNRERVLAPGLLSFDDMRKLYRYEQIDADAPVYGVIGDPVGHSLSPLIHNKAMRHLKMPGVYLPFRVPRAELPDFLRAFDRLPVRGYSVTIPHKEIASTLARPADDTVGAVMAANTLIRDADGWLSYNTDAAAALASLRANLPPDPQSGTVTLANRTVLLLGAGGVARAVAYALQREGSVLTVTNRTADRAHKLAEDVGCRTVEWGARHNVLCDLLINCTSVGMFPNVDESPIHASFLKPEMAVFDAVYTPENTLLVKEAKSRGCHVVTGVDMFVRQAALQFGLFTGKAAPLEYMAKVVRRVLSPVSLGEDEE
jgi:3-dehydroquinate dehydratase/shikimate dehydrogenase